MKLLILSFVLFILNISSACCQSMDDHLFMIIDDLASKENTYITIESDNDYPDVTRFLDKSTELRKMSLSNALSQIFPSYDQVIESNGKLKVIHLISRNISRPYVLDEQVHLHFHGDYSKLVSTIDNNRGKVYLDDPDTNSYSPDDIVYVDELNKPVDSSGKDATVRSELSECFDFVPWWRILWMSKIEEGKVTVHVPGSWHEVKILALDRKPASTPTITPVPTVPKK